MSLRVLDVDGSAFSQAAFAAPPGSGEARRVEARDQPVSAAHFGDRLDWPRFPSTVNCGSWVIRALETLHARWIVTIVPCADDPKCPQITSGSLGAIRERWLEALARRASPAWRWGAPLSASGVEFGGGRLEGRGLAERSWSEFLEQMVASLPTGAVWLIIDKGVLARSKAAANLDQEDNRDQEEMTVDHILEAVDTLAKHRKILGADVCGDYSAPRHAGSFRALLSWALSWADHSSPAVPCAAEIAVNSKTNARRLTNFQEAFI